MIQCRNCGMELPDIAKFCPKCGKMIAPAEPAGTPSEISVFVLGIVSIALATSGLPGLILAIITQSKARAREQAVGPLTGKAKTGQTLAKVALPLSIFFIVLWTVDIIVNAIATWRTFSFLRELFQEFRRYVR